MMTMTKVERDKRISHLKSAIIVLRSMISTGYATKADLLLVYQKETKQSKGHSPGVNLLLDRGYIVVRERFKAKLAQRPGYKTCDFYEVVDIDDATRKQSKNNKTDLMIELAMLHSSY